MGREPSSRIVISFVYKMLVCKVVREMEAGICRLGSAREGAVLHSAPIVVTGDRGRAQQYITLPLLTPSTIHFQPLIFLFKVLPTRAWTRRVGWLEDGFCVLFF